MSEGIHIIDIKLKLHTEKKPKPCVASIKKTTWFHKILSNIRTDSAMFQLDLLGVFKWFESLYGFQKVQN